MEHIVVGRYFSKHGIKSAKLPSFSTASSAEDTGPLPGYTAGADGLKSTGNICITSRGSDEIGNREWMGVAHQLDKQSANTCSLQAMPLYKTSPHQWQQQQPWQKKVT